MRSVPGFTLVEMMAVVIVMGLLATVAALSFTAPLRRARATEAVELIRIFDGNARAAARRFGADVEISFDLSQQELERRMARPDGRRRSEDVAQMRLPGGCRIERLLLAGGEVRDTGEVVIACTRRGLSRSYAVHLTGDRLDRWIVVAGLSGQVVEVSSESEAQSILAPASPVPAASPRRNDAG